MADHELKCWPEQYQAVIEGRKRHEVRRDDRGGYAVKDRLVLQEWDPSLSLFTGRSLECRVTYLGRGGSAPMDDIPGDYVVMSVSGVKVIQREHHPDYERALAEFAQHNDA